MESTGIYHIPLLCYFRDKGFDCSVINPIITKSSTNIGVRQIHNDKFDSKKIALVGLRPGLKTSVVPDDEMAALRDLVRDYDDAVTQRTKSVLKLTGHIKAVWPGYASVFSKLTTRVSLAVLDKWPDPQSLLATPKDEIVNLIRNVSRQGAAYAEDKYTKLADAAKDAFQFGRQLSSSAFRTQLYINSYQHQEECVQHILRYMQEMVADSSETLRGRIELLQTVPGVGFLSAATLLAEIGNVEAFSSGRELAAFFGLDPAVHQSGKFQAEKQHMSKRGSSLARRILHMVSVQNISQHGGTPMNPVIFEFYRKKCESKSKLVALGAVAHKICKTIYAVLRDNQPYVMRTAEEQRTLFAGIRSDSTAA